MHDCHDMQKYEHDNIHKRVKTEGSGRERRVENQEKENLLLPFPPPVWEKVAFAERDMIPF